MAADQGAQGKDKKKKEAKGSDVLAPSPAAEQSHAPAAEAAAKKAKKGKNKIDQTIDQQAVGQPAQAAAHGPSGNSKSKKRKLDAAEEVAAPPAVVFEPEAASEGPSKKKSKKAKKAEAAAAAKAALDYSKPTSASPAASPAAAAQAGSAGKPQKTTSKKQEMADARRRAKKLKKKEKKEKKARKAEEAAAKAALLKATKEKKGDKFKRLKAAREEKRLWTVQMAAQQAGLPIPITLPPVDKEKKKKNKKQRQMAAAAAEEVPSGTPVKAPEQSAGEAASAEPSPAQETAPASDTAPADEAAPSTATENGVSSQMNGNGKGQGRAFQRVKAEEWLDRKGAWDNSYEANFGNSGWGAGAQAVLGQVRGKDFRHEKTKKKRGSYKGGLIDATVNSFKFDSDGE